MAGKRVPLRPVAEGRRQGRSESRKAPARTVLSCSAEKSIRSGSPCGKSVSGCGRRAPATSSRHRRKCGPASSSSAELPCNALFLCRLAQP